MNAIRRMNRLNNTKKAYLNGSIITIIFFFCQYLYIRHFGRSYSMSNMICSPACLINSMICSCLRPLVDVWLIVINASPISNRSALCAVDPGFNCATRARPSLSMPPEMVKPNGKPSFLINSTVVRPLAKSSIKEKHVPKATVTSYTRRTHQHDQKKMDSMVLIYTRS